ncbi:hypothetical protein B0I72DRAFT_138122 [Yarrowia lipolytica]|uniref:Uncharacterized protein n=1 Tax=Yarrowia lipolytica TaxID=4952 RepID=A0A1H6PU98_YARLL|nr:hypothetical protein YALI1_C06994g [Yarrowia lipolytica]KAB8283154.1 hypothetical protein BKA91DRAFT_137234 [Yarrowia lipolytica]KAE8173927.1 hypothetical protein BKA90DRAFT_134884 [Yarrowia lipolytica]KAJ8053091.1 hypothetical protein LXG23DRAFT_49372 [Yarrowia lipolytica]QNP97440.1 Hypothetical protein YALI2_C01093g [Yarrowia lipolytica]
MLKSKNLSALLSQSLTTLPEEPPLSTYGTTSNPPPAIFSSLLGSALGREIAASHINPNAKYLAHYQGLDSDQIASTEQQWLNSVCSGESKKKVHVIFAAQTFSEYLRGCTKALDGSKPKWVTIETNDAVFLVRQIGGEEGLLLVTVATRGTPLGLLFTKTDGVYSELEKGLEGYKVA